MRLLFLIFIIFIIIIIFFKITNPEMTFVKSDIDKRYYMVRNLKDKQYASNILAYNREKILKLIKYLNDNKNQKYKDYKIYINRLVERIVDVNIVENNGIGRETSYSVNKGEELVFCLRSRKEMNTFHTINILMYVILHEISHIACPEYGHGPLFKKIFAFFTKTAMSLKIYEYDDYAKSPKEYCGIYLSDSIV